MNGKHSRRPCGERRRVVCACAAGALVVVMATGCPGEHRVTLNEFIATQRAAAPPVPTTQPIEQTDPMRDFIDSHLGAYRVGPGDVLLVTLTGATEIPLFPPLNARVDRAGEIHLPLVGALKVSGLELQDVERAIREAYVPGVLKDAAISAQVVTVESTNVLVHGAVTQPGLIPLRRTERDLLHAIVGAGGMTEVASGRATLHRVRDPSDVVILDLTAPEELQAALALNPLENGDIIEVESASPNTVIVGGLVNAPQSQVYPPGVEVTVLQALAAAGGVRTDVFPKEATLIRRMPDGTDQHVKLNLNRLARGEDPNITLAAGDILWVPETLETRVQDWFNRNFFIRAGVAANVTYNVSGIEFLNRASQQSTGGGGGGSNLEQAFDPFGFLQRNQAIQAIPTTP